MQRLCAIPASLFFVVLCASQLSATVTTSTSCSVTAASSADPSSCAVNPGNGSAQASASGSFSLAGSLLVTKASTAVGIIPPQFLGGSASSASVNFDLNLSTPGPVRSGYLRIIVSAFSWLNPFDGNNSLQYSLGSISQSCSKDCANTTLFIPFTLGASFELQETQSFSVSEPWYNGSDSGSGSTQLTFSFFEADGTTPLSGLTVLTPSPEPASFALIALGLFGALATAKRR